MIKIFITLSPIRPALEMEFCKKQTPEEFVADSKKVTREAVKELNKYIQSNPETLMPQSSSESESESESESDSDSDMSSCHSKRSKSSKRKHKKSPKISNKTQFTIKELEKTIYNKTLEINNLMIKIEELETANENHTVPLNIIKCIIKYNNIVKKRPEGLISSDIMNSYVKKCSCIILELTSIEKDTNKNISDGERAIIADYIQKIEKLSQSVVIDFNFQSKCIFWICMFMCVLGCYIYYLFH